MPYPQKKHKIIQGQDYFLIGKHAVLSALENPRRQAHSLYITNNQLQQMQARITSLCHKKSIPFHVVSQKEIESKYARDSVHQGMVLHVSPLPEIDLIPWLESITPLSYGRPILVLDKVTDPHNIGAILRSSAAFNAYGVILHHHDSPGETAALAKTASGALDIVPLIRVKNIAESLSTLKEYGFWCLGLDADTNHTLNSISLDDRHVALVLGSEGRGLRQLVASSCDLLVKLPIHSHMESLNVSNAAAIALYEVIRANGFSSLTLNL